MSTKQRILETSIDMFAERGYSAVSIREITRAVGIKESSLYNHFASKQQIFDDILEYLQAQVGSITLSEEEAAVAIAAMTLEQFLALGAQNLRLYFGNPVFVKVWRILSQEKYHNEKAAALFQKYLLDDPIEYQSKVFALMMERGQMRRMNPVHLAREFYSPLLYLYLRYVELDTSGAAADGPEINEVLQAHLTFMVDAMKPRADE